MGADPEDPSDAESLAAYLSAVERELVSPSVGAEASEARRWFRLGAPAAHAAVSIKATRLAAGLSSAD